MRVVGLVAVVLASANVVGGFVVTDRMLEMFKKREPPKPTTRVSTNARQPALPGHDRDCFILALRFLSSPATARRGNWIGAVGMLVAIVVTLAQGRRAQLLGDRRRDGRSAAAFGAVAARAREDDRDAADGGAVQRRRRRRGGARRARGVPPARAARRADLHGDISRRDRPLGADRLDLVRGLAGRVREAAGADPGPADHLSRPEGRQRAAASAPASPPASRSSPAPSSSGCSGRCSAARSSSACCSCCRSAAPTCRS